MFYWPMIIVGATLFFAYANGANDNFKGVATLFGSGIGNGVRQWKMVLRTILAAWVLTLPMAALLSGVVYTLLRSL